MTHSRKTASVYTLGCRLNQADSAHVTDDLSRHGYEIVPWGDRADVLIINSCTVTAAAARKTRKTARAMRRRFPNALIAVIGCDVEVASGDWRDESAVDLVVGNADKHALHQWLESCDQQTAGPRVHLSRPADKGDGFHEEGAARDTQRTRANLKIQEGCDFRCTYCIVPSARGPARSRDWGDILREARELLAAGYKEIVLTGVNIAAYSSAGRDLSDLMQALLELSGRFRIRLSSTEPGPVLQRVIEVMARDRRICRFLHLPLQYGENSMLRAMNRRYDVASFACFAERAVEKVPGVCLGTDLIVGFPGESEATFSTCCDTIRNLPVNHLHVFTFSPRAGTPAASLPRRVRGDVAAERARILSEIGQAKARDFAASQLGSCLHIITETTDVLGRWEGWSDNYLRTTVLNDLNVGDNEWVEVRITEVENGRHVAGYGVTADEKRP